MGGVVVWREWLYGGSGCMEGVVYGGSGCMGGVVVWPGGSGLWGEWLYFCSTVRMYILYKLKMPSAKSDSKHVLYFGGIKASSTPAQKQRRINHFAKG